VLDHDDEAARYDATRGGDARADAAATAFGRLLPSSAGVVLDVAGGTGIVGARLRGVGRRVVSVDRSAAMAAIAATRLPGDVVLGDATGLPIADRGVDAVTIVWLLHLLDEAASAAVLAEVARVLRPGGTLVTTVDKSEAHYRTDADVTDVVLPAWRAMSGQATDGLERVTGLLAEHGLVPAGATTFTGTGQGRSPRQWQRYLAEPANGWQRGCGPAAVAEVCRELAALPEQDRRRSDPRFQVAAFVRPVGGVG
jgi:SAM-dependent methyltransferase